MGTSSHPFDPRKTTTVELEDIRRYQRERKWEEVKLLLKVLLISGVVLALALWAIVEKL